MEFQDAWNCAGRSEKRLLRPKRDGHPLLFADRDKVVAAANKLTARRSTAARSAIDLGLLFVLGEDRALGPRMCTAPTQCLHSVTCAPALALAPVCVRSGGLAPTHLLVLVCVSMPVSVSVSVSVPHATVRDLELAVRVHGRTEV